ncbi:hypothetical protein JB92DRAFT_3150575 [Gautieria morchelliformis]|nr:hypothetical protein JB92DRAFT_3150575 [Gautieria morchelliformis]
MTPRRPSLASARGHLCSAILSDYHRPRRHLLQLARLRPLILSCPPRQQQSLEAQAIAIQPLPVASDARACVPNGNKHTAFSDDDNNVPDHDDNDIARLSNEKYPGKRKYRPSSSTLERVKSLTERNRKVIDKLSSITSPDCHSGSSPSAPSTSSSRSRSPLPPTFSSSSSTASTSSRISLAPSQLGIPVLKLSARSSILAAAHHRGLPRAHTPGLQRSEPRQRLRSAPSSPATPSCSDTKYSACTQDHERTISPGVLVARGAASPQSAGAGGTFSVTPTSPRGQQPARPSTLRDSSGCVQRWSSVDEVALNGNGNSPSRDDPDGRRQSRHAGSAESPLGGREGRSVVGEGLRAAGLARRGWEDVLAEGVPQRRTQLSGGLGRRL